MTHWDGLTSANAQGRPERILILGATNRIQDIDEAILRRMPKKFPVSLPASPQRRRILDLILRDTKLDKDNFDMDYLVRVTAGMSGSDIKEACRDAAMVPVREFIRSKIGARAQLNEIDPSEVRGIRTDDFFGRRRTKRESTVPDINSGPSTRIVNPTIDNEEEEEDEDARVDIDILGN
jgi:ATPase family AAA domain-containing protein 1